MFTRVQKLGKSLVLKIPKEIASEAHLEENLMVELVIEKGKLFVKPVEEVTLSLEELLAGINERNTHHEVDWGSLAGKEIW